jgi:hypothetical protein
MEVSVMDLGHKPLATDGFILGPNGTQTVALVGTDNCGLPVLLRIALGDPMQIIDVQARPFGTVGSRSKINITDAAIVAGDRSRIGN